MKRYIYLGVWIILGVELAAITHAVIEISFIKYLLANDTAPVNHPFLGHAYCALPQWLQASLLILGIALGIFAGNYFWRIIYIKHRGNFRNGNMR